MRVKRCQGVVKSCRVLPLASLSWPAAVSPSKSEARASPFRVLYPHLFHCAVPTQRHQAVTLSKVQQSDNRNLLNPGIITTMIVRRAGTPLTSRQLKHMGPYIHNIDPVMIQVGGICLWWYGLSYFLGFLEIHIHLRRARSRLGLTLSQVYSLTLHFMGGVLLGGRLIEVAFDEWPFYRQHIAMIPAYWLGGMASHGVLLGAATGIYLFCCRHRRPLRPIADEFAIPGAFLLGIGRIGNFIDGQILGRIADVWWAVKFPDAEGFRHPVLLYDGAKNLLLIPLLSWIRKSRPVEGVVSAWFIFLYAFLRIFIDLWRDYPLHRLPLGTGQTLNIVMSVLGICLLVRSHLRARASRRIDVTRRVPPGGVSISESPLLLKRALFTSVLLFSLTIPSNWTQDVPARYGRRHPGLQYSILYPRLDTNPPGGRVTDRR